MSFEYKKPIIGQIRSGKEDDPFILITNDVKKVTNGYCKLDEIPDELNHVTIISIEEPYDGEVYYEIFDKTKDIGRYEYRVDYINGIVYFHNDAEGRIITFSYYGRGCQFISADRIFTKESGGNVVETLKDMTNNANELITSLESIDDRLNTIETKVDEGVAQLEQDVSELSTTVGQHTTRIGEIEDILENIEGITIVDNLTSTSTTSALSANQGKILKDDLDTHKAEIATETEYGHVRLADLPVGSSQGGKRVARFTIGTTQNGWTAEEVDYLCDGVDDQEEIIQALNDLPETGGEVVILDGTYNITASINIPKNNVSLRGNGNATILKRMYDSADRESGPTAKGLITLFGQSGCKIQGLQIDGNKATYTGNYNCGISLSSSSNNTVTGNTCNNNSNSGILLYTSHGNTITGNTCNNNNEAGIALYRSNNNTITGNTCNNNSYPGILLYLSSGNTVTGNTCNNNNFGICLLASSNNTIAVNTYNNNNNGICLRDSSDSNTITGNTCNNNNETGIYLMGSRKNTVTGNTCIRGTGTPEDYTTNQYTILLSGTGNNYNLISLNNCMGKAVVVEGGTGNSAWGNKYDSGDDLPI